MKFVKHEHGKRKSDADGLRQSKDVRAPHERNVDRTELYNLRCKLENLANKKQAQEKIHLTKTMTWMYQETKEVRC